MAWTGAGGGQSRRTDVPEKRERAEATTSAWPCRSVFLARHRGRCRNRHKASQLSQPSPSPFPSNPWGWGWSTAKWSYGMSPQSRLAVAAGCTPSEYDGSQSPAGVLPVGAVWLAGYVAVVVVVLVVAGRSRLFDRRMTSHRSVGPRGAGLGRPGIDTELTETTVHGEDPHRPPIPRVGWMGTLNGGPHQARTETLRAVDAPGLVPAVPLPDAREGKALARMCAASTVPPSECP